VLYLFIMLTLVEIYTLTTNTSYPNFSLQLSTLLIHFIYCRLRYIVAMITAQQVPHFTELQKIFLVFRSVFILKSLHII
jgi:hypothetical protein